ncbi:MAG: Abi-alpha family protein [Candidatus Brocadia sinica]|nr:Abi-alpha family protein [Candidatus Brocadia sinica]
MIDEENAVTEVSKAIREIAKASGKAIDTVRSLGSFVADVISGPIDQAMGIVKDKLVYMRWERQARFIKRAEELFRKLGIANRHKAVPMSIAIPLLQSAFLEEDDELQDMWVQLLANAADAANADCRREVRRAYISILQDMTSLDAAIMQKLLTVPEELVFENPGGDERHFLDEAVLLALANLARLGLITGTMVLDGSIIYDKILTVPEELVFENPGGDERHFPDEAVLLALANLARLGLITGTMVLDGSVIYDKILPTRLRYNFILACTATRKGDPTRSRS